MAKEILFYTSINSYSVADFIGQLEANKGNDICARIYCPGGDVYATYGMIAKWNEHPVSKKRMKVDGRADSSAAFMLCSSDDNECLSISKFTFHRAAYPSWIENDKARFTDGLKASLNETNLDLRALIERVCTAEKWLEVTGVSLDDMFSLDSRIDVEISAKQAKELGFVQKIIPLTQAKQKEINAICGTVGIAAIYTEAEIKATTTTSTENKKSMKAGEIKAAHPEAYAEILAEGATQERERVEAYMEWVDVDAKAVAEGIASGKMPTAKFNAQMARKSMSAEGLKNVEAANAADVAKPDASAELTDAQKASKAFVTDLQAKTLGNMDIKASA